MASRKNMIVSGIIQFFVIGLFLMLGTLLLMYAQYQGITMPEKSDELFSIIATHPTLPICVGLFFIIGLISAAYSAAGSAITSLTTSVTLDLLDGVRRTGGDEQKLARLRSRVHVVMALLMGLIIVAFYYISSDDAISAVYTLASYTYGPILGLFAFGIFTSRRAADRLVPLICLASPVVAWIIQWSLREYADYSVGFELLLINGAITFLALALSSLIVSSPDYVKESA